ncbi:hypothetical protein [Clostridium estertheticum]|uniref:hypothetical protein n=1 Tax=Clostridium estertheticum TaxID=238834 RepID=UPI001C0B7398|nr:hypothetical protein [Clostridium estertheticum]MBU3174432.1 hypothetical protein [Clostridium estertheticum]
MIKEIDCKVCGCRGYERVPTPSEKKSLEDAQILDCFTFLHCPICDVDYKVYMRTEL